MPRHLSDLKTRHAMNIVASNNSWGGGGFSQGLYDAIERAGSGHPGPALSESGA